MTDPITIQEQAAAVRELKRAAADAVAEGKKLSAKHKEAELALFERMEQEEIQSIKHRGTLFCPTETIYGQVQDRTEFVAWAAENDLSLVETKERKGLLNELVREKLDNGEALPPGIGFYTDKYISQRGS